MGQDFAAQVAPELFLDVGGHAVAHRIAFGGHGQIALQVLPDDAVQGGGLGPPPPVGLGMRARRRLWGGRRPAGLPLARMGLGGHRRIVTSRGARWSVSMPRRCDRWGGGMERRVETQTPETLLRSGGYSNGCRTNGSFGTGRVPAPLGSGFRHPQGCAGPSPGAALTLGRVGSPAKIRSLSPFGANTRTPRLRRGPVS